MNLDMNNLKFQTTTLCFKNLKRNEKLKCISVSRQLAVEFKIGYCYVIESSSFDSDNKKYYNLYGHPYINLYEENFEYVNELLFKS